MSGLDFSQLGGGSAADSATEPRRIFTALPSKDSKYAYPRDVQSEVWEQWHGRRNDTDLVIKMNTGGGKTVVGLLLLKSCLNEGIYPAAYFCPDNYLAEQVRAEAQALGISVTDDPESQLFQTGSSILVHNIYKLINGRSVFGVKGDSRVGIPIDAILIDDAHACLDTVKEQYTLQIESGHKAYDSLLNLFETDLKQQSPSKLSDLKRGDRSSVIEIPYWAWIKQNDKVLNILSPCRDDEALKFKWPLIRECLNLCRAAIGSERIEIQPSCPPHDRIPSLSSARRRIFLTATLADDSVLVTHFGANAETVSKPITPATADDLGDRMILSPFAIYRNICDEEIRDFLVQQASTRNVVVIVPSRRRASYWEEVAAGIFDRDNIKAGVDALQSGHFGLAVLINKYDGIDLPGDACRVLVVDGLPEAYGLIERLDAVALDQSDAMLSRQLQRIEQGMGRAVRSNDDFACVLLLGARLTQRLNHPRAKEHFSPATHAQIALSFEVAKMLHSKPFGDLKNVIQQCLSRDQHWVNASRRALDGITYSDAKVSPVAVAQRRAFDQAEVGNYENAGNRLQEVFSEITDKQLRGFLKQQGAAYIYHYDAVRSQELQASAVTDNPNLLKPIRGITYNRLPSSIDQARRAARFLSEHYPSENELILSINALLDDLTPTSYDSAAVSKFEEAMHQLGFHLGFDSQRPERDRGQGPDVLWSLGDLVFAVIECKSGTESDFVAKHDAGQLGHSIDWFKGNYDTLCHAIPVMIHKSANLDRGVATREGARIITYKKLASLRESVRQFATSLASNNAYKNSDNVRNNLISQNLHGNGFFNHWGQAPRTR